VAEVQSIQERIKFEFVEALSSFLYSWLSFYHIGHVVHNDFQDVYNAINNRVQKAKESFEATQTEAEELKRRMLIAYFKNAVISSANSAEAAVLRPFNSNIKQGYLYVLEKSLLPSEWGWMEDPLLIHPLILLLCFPEPAIQSLSSLSRNSWTKYYCVYSKETRIFTMIPSSHSTKGVCPMA